MGCQLLWQHAQRTYLEAPTQSGSRYGADLWALSTASPNPGVSTTVKRNFTPFSSMSTVVASMFTVCLMRSRCETVWRAILSSSSSNNIFPLHTHTYFLTQHASCRNSYPDNPLPKKQKNKQKKDGTVCTYLQLVRYLCSRKSWWETAIEEE